MSQQLSPEQTAQKLVSEISNITGLGQDMRAVIAREVGFGRAKDGQPIVRWTAQATIDRFLSYLQELGVQKKPLENRVVTVRVQRPNGKVQKQRLTVRMQTSGEGHRREIWIQKGMQWSATLVFLLMKLPDSEKAGWRWDSVQQNNPRQKRTPLRCGSCVLVNQRYSLTTGALVSATWEQTQMARSREGDGVWMVAIRAIDATSCGRYLLKDWIKVLEGKKDPQWWPNLSVLERLEKTPEKVMKTIQRKHTDPQKELGRVVLAIENEKVLTIDDLKNVVNMEVVRNRLRQGGASPLQNSSWLFRVQSNGLSWIGNTQQWTASARTEEVLLRWRAVWQRFLLFNELNTQSQTKAHKVQQKQCAGRSKRM